MATAALHNSARCGSRCVAVRTHAPTYRWFIVSLHGGMRDSCCHRQPRSVHCSTIPPLPESALHAALAIVAAATAHSRSRMAGP